MKTYNDRKTDISARIQKKRKQRKMLCGSCLLLALVVAMGCLWLPGGNLPETVGNPTQGTVANQPPVNVPTVTYSQVAQKLQAIFDHNLDVDFDIGFDDEMDVPTGVPMPGIGSAPTNPDPTEKPYVEVTDNQVQGVTEADLFKRTHKHIFYLCETEITVFTIAGENSCKVGSYTISLQDAKALGEYSGLMDVGGMYLSQDGKTITVLLHAFYMNAETYADVYTIVVSLDVSDPANIQETGRKYVEGGYLSSRMVDGQLLMMSRYRVSPTRFDAEDPHSYIPCVGDGENMKLIPAEDLIVPEEASSAYYTILCSVDPETLEIKDTVACLGYGTEVYVSRDHIFVSCNYTFRTVGNKDAETILTEAYGYKDYVEIACIGYSKDSLTIRGCVKLDGHIKDQYSMDEYNGVLRVVTSTEQVAWGENGDESIQVVAQSASLYCVSLETFTVIASVENFAPQGESAQSVRFDGDKAYVCTADVIALTDPVYFFDLSDLENITYTDTGTIDGYSSSLIQLQDGYLLGIGYGDRWQLKIEVYAKDGSRVVSVDQYLRDASFSEEYKSYYIDRENSLIGLGVRDNTGICYYILLHFDGSALHLIREVELTNYRLDISDIRADLIDGYLYIMGHGMKYSPDQTLHTVMLQVVKIR